MTPKELQERCQTLGHRSADVETCLQFLESILTNPQELPARKDLSLTLLRTYCQSTPSQPGVLAACQLQARYDHQPIETPDPALVARLRQLVYPQDPGWRELLPELQQQRHAASIREYGQRLVEQTEKALKSANTNSTAELRALKPLLSDVLAYLGEQLDSASRIQLHEWLRHIAYQEQEARSRELVEKLEHIYASIRQNPDRWETIVKLSQELKRIASTRRQTDYADRLLAEANDYRRWRQGFDTTVAKLRGYRCRQPPAFPWDASNPQADPEPKQLQDSTEGLARWGGDQDRKDWSAALTEVGKQILDRIQQLPDSSTALSHLQQLRQTWPPYPDLVALTEIAPQWETVEAGLRDALSVQLEPRLQAFRDSYDGQTTVQAFLDSHPDIQQQATYLKPLFDHFQQEVASLQTLSQTLQHWQTTGDPQLLHTNALDQAERNLATLAERWSRSPLHRQLTQRCKTLRTELTELVKVQRLLEQGRYGEAKELLQPSFCSAMAEQLRTLVASKLRDQKLQALIESGRLSDIAPAELQAASPEVQHRYQAVVRGRNYLGDFKARIDRLQRQDYGAYIRAGWRLLQASIPEEVQFALPDQTELEALRMTLSSDLEQRLEQAAQQLLDRCQPFPLPPPPRLATLEKQRDAVLESLTLPVFNSKLVDLIRRQLEPALTIMQVQRACHQQAWDQAEQGLQDPQAPLNPEQRRKLRATVLSNRYQATATDDPTWLALYAELPDLLLQAPHDRRHYLTLLRQATLAAPDLRLHLIILQEVFPEEPYLFSLLGCFADPTLAQVQAVSGEPRPEDRTVLRRLLETWATEPTRYRPLQLLWENLSITLRRQVWNLPESPLQQLQQALRQRLQRLRAELADPDRPLFQLKAELDNFMVLGLLTDADKALVTQLDQASAIERRLADLDRQDLWDAGHLATVNEMARLLDGLPSAISEGRGWRRRLERQQRGIAAWDHLEIAWTTFRGYSDGIDTGFHRNPSAWQEVILRLDGWCRALAQWAPEVDWGLPGAGNSQRWLMLAAAWQTTAEGRLWLAANKPLPANPAELQQAYSETLQQVNKFAELHAELLKLIPTYIPDPDPDLCERLREPLNRLHELQPLSRPVRDVRQQLTDAEVSHVGKLYHRLFRE